MEVQVQHLLQDILLAVEVDQIHLVEVPQGQMVLVVLAVVELVLVLVGVQEQLILVVEAVGLLLVDLLELVVQV